jgi:uncharacterized membrane protein
MHSPATSTDSKLSPPPFSVWRAIIALLTRAFLTAILGAVSLLFLIFHDFFPAIYLSMHAGWPVLFFIGIFLLYSAFAFTRKSLPFAQIAGYSFGAVLALLLTLPS